MTPGPKSVVAGVTLMRTAAVKTAVSASGVVHVSRNGGGLGGAAPEAIVVVVVECKTPSRVRWSLIYQRSSQVCRVYLSLTGGYRQQQVP